MDTQRMLLLSKLNLNEDGKMFSTMCKELKLVLGGGPGQRSVEGVNVKKEAIIVEKDEVEDDIFITFNGAKYYRNEWRSRERGGGHS